MALLQGDDDDKVFEATMSFIDEFSFDEPEVEATLKVAVPKTPTLQMQGQTDLMAMFQDAKTIATSMDVVDILRDGGSHATKSTARCKVPSILSLDTTGMTNREKIMARNARKKLLRKAGIYGDSNRVRNERKLEIAYLRE